MGILEEERAHIATDKIIDTERKIHMNIKKERKRERLNYYKDTIDHVERDNTIEKLNHEIGLITDKINNLEK